MDHTATIRIPLVVLAVVFFLLDGFKVQAAVSWTPLGFACMAATLL